MKCFLGKIRKIPSICGLLKILPSAKLKKLYDVSLLYLNNDRHHLGIIQGLNADYCTDKKYK